MSETFRPAGGWGPRQQRAALSITFDNFGEAAEIETGRYTADEIGNHHTASFLPRLMDTLGEVKATYFMEASNAEIYPDQIRSWDAAGHEVGLHGWRHEAWAQCPDGKRAKLLADSTAAMHAIGIHPVGFRPPGGGMPPGAWGELEAAGLRYCSPLGPQGVARVGKVVSLPFEWRAVDAFMLEPVLGFLRVHFGEQEAPSSIAEWSANLADMLKDLVAKGQHRTLIFHPEFLGLDDGKLGAVRQLIEAAQAEDVWIAPARDVAAYVADAMDLPILEAA